MKLRHIRGGLDYLSTLNLMYFSGARAPSYFMGFYKADHRNRMGIPSDAEAIRLGCLGAVKSKGSGFLPYFLNHSRHSNHRNSTAIKYEGSEYHRRTDYMIPFYILYYSRCESGLPIHNQCKVVSQIKDFISLMLRVLYNED